MSDNNEIENEEMINIEELRNQIDDNELFQIIKTDQSFHEGTGLTKEYISKAAELGVKNLVLADRNTLSDLVKFYKGCKANDINPIIGNTLRLEYMEADIEELLIRNEQGINKLSSFKKADTTPLFKDLNLFKAFSGEEGFEVLKDISIMVEKFKKSKAKTKELGFVEDLTKRIREIKPDFEIIDEKILSEITASQKSKKTFNLSEAISHHFDIEMFNQYIDELDLELTTTDLLVISHNEEGVQNIKELVSLAYLEGQENVKVEKTQDKVKRVINSHATVTPEKIQSHIDGIRIFLGDSQDILGRAILKSKRDGVRVLQKMQELFGDSLYLYIKNSTKDDNPRYIDDEKILNSRILELSNELGIPCVGTHDARFVNEEDYVIHDVKSSILLKENFDALSRDKHEFKGQYLLSNEELKEKFRDYPELLLNNQVVSSDSDVFIKLGKCYLPNFNIDDDFTLDTLQAECDSLSISTDRSFEDMKAKLITHYTPEIEEKFSGKEDEWEYEKENKINNIVSGKYMEVIGWEGVEEKMIKKVGEEKWSEMRDKYHERYMYEVNIINDMGFPGYFLIVQEFINWGKKTGVPVGPGRGSGAGSLVAFGLNITALDPIKDDLLFERFLNPERVSMPDFDIDFGDGFDENGNEVGRGTVIEHVKELYANLQTGKPTVSQIATNGEFAVKSAIRAVCKALGHTMPFQDNLADLVPDDPSVKFKDLFEDEDFMQRYETEKQFKKVIDIAVRVYGRKQNSGVHAGGVVIAPTSLTDFSPVQCAPDGSGLVTQLDKNDVEDAGLVKFDFLGLKTLSVIQEALKRINATLPEENKINIDFIDENDSTTFEMLRKAQTHGVFQIESAGMTQLVDELQVDTVSEISDLLALYRPGPMQSGMMDNYVTVRKELLAKREETGKNIADITMDDIDMNMLTEKQRDAFTAIHPDLLETVMPTNNQMIYQEQVMTAGQIIADYTLGGADMLRRAMGKKKPEEMRKQKLLFINGAFNNYRENWKTVTSKSKKTGNLAIDVDLTDIVDRLGLSDFVDIENGCKYLNSEEKVFKFFKEFVGYNDNKMEEFEMAVNKYKVQDFVKIHGEGVKKAMFDKCKAAGMSDEDTKSSWMRVHYSLSQFVRLNYVFSAIEKFAAYGFNKSHSLAYAMVSFQTAYIKANYPVEFYASTLTYQSDDLDKINVTAADAKKHFEIDILPANVNESEYLFKPLRDDNKIRYGLSAIKGLGANANSIYVERLENGEYTSFEDLIYRVHHRNILNGAKNPKLNIKNIEGLTHSGALDQFIPDYILNNDRIKQKREYIVNKYNNLMNSGIYPAKAVIEKMVPERLNTGEYPDKYFYDVNKSKYDNDRQKTIADEIAYRKLADLIYKEGEIFGEETSEEKGKKKKKAIPKNVVSEMAVLSEKVDLIIDRMKEGVYQNVFKEIEDRLIKTCQVETIHNLVKEKEFTGLFISQHPVHVDNIKNNTKLDPDGNLYDINQITPEKDGNHARIMGVVSDIREIVIKNGKSSGKKMAIVTIEDDTTSIECSFFPDQYAKAKNMLVKNSLIMLDGKISNSEKYGLGFQPDAMESKIPKTDYTSLQSDNNKRKNIGRIMNGLINSTGGY